VRIFLAEKVRSFHTAWVIGAYLVEVCILSEVRIRSIGLWIFWIWFQIIHHPTSDALCSFFTTLIAPLHHSAFTIGISKLIRPNIKSLFVSTVVVAAIILVVIDIIV
jgi:hypothetical protein